MGRFWLGIGILAVFLIGGLWVGHAMDDVHQTIAQSLDDAAVRCLNGDLPGGMVLAQQAQELWQSHWHGTASVADHEPMDEIDGLFAQLEVYGKAGLSADFATYCSRLSRLVSAMGEAHAFTWWNLL